MQEPRRRVSGYWRKGALAAAFALLFVAVVTGAASAHTLTHLSNASVSPRLATTSDTVTFSVLYTDVSGAAPRSVVVAVDQLSWTMSPARGSYRTGETYRYTTRLPAGKHVVAFKATDATGVTETFGAGAVWVRLAQSTDPGSWTGDPGTSPAPTSTAPAAPKPTPTPTPTAPPAPRPTPTPTPAAPPAPKPTATPNPTPPPAVRPTPAHGSNPPAGPFVPAPPAGDPPANAPLPPDERVVPADVAPGQQTLPPGGMAAPLDPPAPSPSDGGAANAVVAGATHDGNGALPAAVRGGNGGGTHARVTIDSLTLGSRMSLSTLATQLAPTIATGTAGATAWAAFIIFGKRRRDGSPPEPEEVLATAAATAIEAPAAAGLPQYDESLMPRWRRPSLQAARKIDPLRTVTEAQHLSFETAGVRPLDGLERREIGYRLVRLLDRPDELTSVEIGLLDKGDEVQLVERHGAYWHVLCPDGRAGWVHRMTLAEPADRGDAQVQSPSRADDSVDVDPNGILDIYLRARRQD